MKILNSIKFDGWRNTFQNISTFIKKRTYGKSYTVLLNVKLSKLTSVKLNTNTKVIIVKADVVTESNLLNLPRSRVNNWLDSGAELYLAKLNNKTVGYTFIHLNKYNVDGVGVINLKEDKSLWIGPTFVDKKSRSQGINKQLINISASHYVDDRVTALTSANINNVNSIKSFIRNGFTLTDVFICTYALGRQKLVRLVGHE